MKITIENVYRKFNRKFRKFNRKTYPYSTALVLKVLTALIFIYFVFDIFFWSLWTAQLLADYQHKIHLFETYLEVQRELSQSDSCR